MGESYRRAPHVAWRRIGDEYVCVNLATKEMVGLDPGGGAILERLAQPRATADLLALFDPAAEPDGALLEAFVHELAEAGLLVTDETPPDGDLPASEGDQIPWGPPRVLWRERLTAAVNQNSPPQVVGFPDCGF